MSALQWLVLDLPEVPTTAIAKSMWPAWAADQELVTFGWVHGPEFEVVDATRWAEFTACPIEPADRIQGRLLPSPPLLCPYVTRPCFLSTLARRSHRWVEQADDMDSLIASMWRHQ